MNLVLWRGYTSPQRPSSQRYLGHSVEYYVDTDASTLTNWHVYAKLSAYQFASGISPQQLNFYYFTGTHASPQYYDSDPYYYQRLYVNNTNGVLGSAVQFDAGEYANGATVSPYYFVGNNLGGTWYYSEYSTLPAVPSAPAACATVTATRNSDSQATVTWDTTPSANANIMRIRRYADGSTLSATWTYDGSANFINSYVDTGISTGHAYTYTIEYGYYASTYLRDAGFTLWASAATSSAIYTSPAAPTAISGSRTAATTVRLTLTNTASTSTGLEVQASTSSSDWSGAVSQTFAGAGLSTAEITGLSGIYYFRARNTRGALVSAWSPVSDPVATLTPPAAPTLLAPTGAVWNIATPTITYRWQHNPLDGSAQTAAELQTSTNGGSTWTTYSETTAQAHSVTYSGANVGQTVTWRVRTKGADASWGPYSAAKSFLIAQAPSISIMLEDGNGNPLGGTLSDMPLVYVLTVNDPSGTIAGATVSVGGYTEDATSLSGQIDAAEFLPENNSTYTFAVQVQSTSTLTASASTTFDTSFILPQAGTLAVTDDSGIETLTVGLEAQQPGETAATSIAVYREYAGGMVLLAKDLSNGDTISDLYAPLNADFAYIVATFSAAGIAKQTRFSQHIKSSNWQVIYGGGKVASAIWNPAGDITLKRPQRTLVQYIGRTYPVSYDGTAMSDERSMSWVLLSEDERDSFIDLMASGGVGVYKSGDGAVFMAAFDVKFKPAYTTRTRYGTISLSVTRIESGAL